MKKFKVGITGIDPFSGNRGVGALAISAIYILQQVAKNIGVELEISIINFKLSKINEIDINGEKVKVLGIEPFGFSSIKDFIRLVAVGKTRRSFQDYLKLDYIFCVGEGDSFSDIYGLPRFAQIDNQHVIARKLRKPYSLLPQTIGPFSEVIVKNKAVKSINLANSVFPRDSISYNWVKSNTEQRNNTEVIDMAFFMPHKKDSFNSNYTHVGLNVSGLLWNGGYTKNNQFGLKSNYQELIYDIIDFFKEMANTKLHLVAHVVSINRIVENDYHVIQELAKKLNNPNIIASPLFLDPIQAKNYIGGMDYFMGARMHSAIAAFSAGVPVFPMAYSRKFNGLFVETLKYPYFGDLVNQGSIEIMDKVKWGFEHRLELKERISAIQESILKDKYDLMVDHLSKILLSTK